MASNTPNLNLLKKDPVTDGDDTFNIKTMLNDNWDKIDEAIGEVKEELQDIDIPHASLTQAGITQLSSETNSYTEDKAATPKAVKSAYDAASAAQLTANAANTAAVAAQTKANEAFQAGNERKAEVVAALVALGVSASTNDSWDTLISKMATVIKATGNAAVGDVLTGKMFSNAGANGLTGTMPNQGAKTSTITTQGGQYTIPSGYHNGNGKITASFANLIPENIKRGVNVGGVAGDLLLGGVGELNIDFNGYVDRTSNGFFIDIFDFPLGIKYFSICPESFYLGYAYQDNDPGMFLLLENQDSQTGFNLWYDKLGDRGDNLYLDNLFVDLIHGIAYLKGTEYYNSRIPYDTIGIFPNYDVSKPQKLRVKLSKGNEYSVRIKGKVFYA